MYLGVGAVLYLVLLLLGNANKAVFLICAMLSVPSTAPASHRAGYLRDLFAPSSRRHPRPAAHRWSVAGVLGPIIVDAIATSRRPPGCPYRPVHAVVRIMIGLLIVGFVCNELIKPSTRSSTSPPGAVRWPERRR